MKKTTLLFALLLIACNSFAQSLLFEIEPYIVNRNVITPDTSFLMRSDTCKQIGLTICGIGTDSACVNYVLYREDGSIFESGTKNTSFDAVAIVISKPLNLTNVNMILAHWNIEAVMQVLPEEEE